MRQAMQVITLTAMVFSVPSIGFAQERSIFQQFGDLLEALDGAQAAPAVRVSPRIRERRDQRAAVKTTECEYEVDARVDRRGM